MGAEESKPVEKKGDNEAKIKPNKLIISSTRIHIDRLTNVKYRAAVLEAIAKDIKSIEENSDIGKKGDSKEFNEISNIIIVLVYDNCCCMLAKRVASIGEYKEMIDPVKNLKTKKQIKKYWLENIDMFELVEEIKDIDIDNDV